MNRAPGWLQQAESDLEIARITAQAGRHEWACFAAQQAAEKAVKALHLHLGQEAWGHLVTRLLTELPNTVPSMLVEKARSLDTLYEPTRYPDAFPAGAPAEHTAPCRAGRRSPTLVRSLRSSVLRWPGRAEVLQALATWAQRLELPGLAAVGAFSSYARGEAGVGSDLNVLVIVEERALPFERRMAQLPLEELPVPAEALVYTREEWERLGERCRGLAETLRRETVWVRGGVD
jgi:HEPN domain-containing protein/predicted nucleotidyltransferase